MCQITVEWLFDRVWPSHIRKVASLSAQALSLILRTSPKRVSKKFATRKHYQVTTKLAHLGYALSHRVGYKGKVHQAFSEQPKGCYALCLSWWWQCWGQP